MRDVLAGVYRHYKGPLYLVLGPAHDANADEFYDDTTFGASPLFVDGRNVIVYIGLELDDAHDGPRMAVRTYDDFFLPVCWNPHCERYGTDGQTPEDGRCSLCTRRLGSRFEYVGPTWEGPS